jgi:hypothetical protein
MKGKYQIKFLSERGHYATLHAFTLQEAKVIMKDKSLHPQGFHTICGGDDDIESAIYKGKECLDSIMWAFMPVNKREINQSKKKLGIK